MKTIRTHMGREIYVMAEAIIRPYVEVHSSVTLHLDRLSERTKRQILLNLRRGCCSSISGLAYRIHRVLAGRFGFPVFANGRADRLLISQHHLTASRRAELTERFAALYKLGSASGNYRAQNYSHYVGSEDGPASNWTLLSYLRSRNMDMRAVLAQLEVDSLWEIIPKDATLAATSAVLRGEVLNV